MTSTQDLNYPIGELIEKTDSRPVCQICCKERSNFYCKKCQVSFCLNCEKDVHTPFLKKQHQNCLRDLSIFRQKILPKTRCNKHNKKFTHFCVKENRLICSKCVLDCSQNKHLIISFKTATKQFSKRIAEHEKRIHKMETKTKLEMEKTIQNQKQLNEAIRILYAKIHNQTVLLKKQLDLLERRCETILTESTQFINRNSKKTISKQQQLLAKAENEKQAISQIYEAEKSKVDQVELIQMYASVTENSLQKGVNYQPIPKNYATTFNRILTTKFLELSNNGHTIINKSGSDWGFGVACGNKIYHRGYNVITLNIDQFPLLEAMTNFISIGAIDANNQHNLIVGNNFQGSYFIDVRKYFSKSKINFDCCKIKHTRKKTKANYDAIFNEGDKIKIILDMNKKEISYQINERRFGTAWNELPESVVLFVVMRNVRNTKKNQISFIS
ncbi:e3 ubiquitin-protein ligase triml1-related [Anaeramoeba flamelloides]|uniref:E3 ubiquitin-protein ligase triml1-related n=1 Tax=Anaeramoeba flamelloides TaxID=1746091 RepID=A0AAV8A3J7_9EUKA|nr:e3 ubiquitin-protein ligase triml1-related [Anaeramoeba flamelloides]